MYVARESIRGAGKSPSASRVDYFLLTRTDILSLGPLSSESLLIAPALVSVPLAGVETLTGWIEPLPTEVRVLLTASSHCDRLRSGAETETTTPSSPFQIEWGPSQETFGLTCSCNLITTFPPGTTISFPTSPLASAMDALSRWLITWRQGADVKCKFNTVDDRLSTTDFAVAAAERIKMEIRWDG